MAIDLGDMPKGTPPTPQQQAQIRSSIGLGTSGSAGFSSLVLTGQSITGTAANSLLDMTTTWNTSGIPSAIKLNVNDVASNAASNLLDLQVGGSSKFKVDKVGLLKVGGIGFSNSYGIITEGGISVGSGATFIAGSQLNVYNGGLNICSLNTGGIQTTNVGAITWGSGTSISAPDLYLSRRAAANLRVGAADAAAPVAQTLSVQSVIAGTTNTAGVDFTIDGSQGTGTGAGGSIVFRTAPTGSSGTAQNPLSSSIVIDGQGVLNIPAAPTANTTGMLRIVHEQTGQLRPGIYATSYGDMSLATYGNGGPSNIGCMYSKFIFSRRGLVVGTSSAFGYDPTANGQIGDALYFGNGTSTIDISLGREAANTLALRNGLSAQVFRLYNTYTDATTFERLNLKWDTNVLKLGTEKGSVGGAARDLVLETDATERLRVLSTGNVGIGTSTPTQKLQVNGSFSIYPNSSNSESRLITRSIHADGRWALDIRSSTAGGDVQALAIYQNFLGIGSGEFTSAISSAIGIFGNIAHIPKLRIAGNTTGPNNASGLVIGSSNSTEWLQGASYPDGLNYYEIRTNLSSPAQLGGMVVVPTRAPLNIDAKYLSFLTGNTTGVEAMRITGAGGIGIGTAAPISNLEVVQPTTGAGLVSVDAAGTTVTGVGTQFLNTFKIGDTITSAGQTLTISAIASDTSMTTSAAGAAIVAAGYTLVGGSILRVQGNGRVGVGSSSPTTIFDINDNTGNQKNVILTIRNGNFGWWTVTSSNTNSAGFLRFSSLNSARNPLTLDGVTGNVGIEKSTPTAKLDISDINLSGSGALAGSALNIEQTWNTTGNPSMIYGRVTNTASGASSNLINLGTVASGELFKVTKAGNVSFGSAAGFHQSLEPFGNTAFNIKCYGTVVGGFASTDYPQGLQLNSSSSLIWTNGAGGINNAANVDIYLTRDAAGTLAQRNLANAQTFRVYNSTDATPATNFDRATFGWTSNVLKIGTEMGGSYTTARYLELLVGGVTKVTISPAWVTFGDAVFADKTITIKGSGTSTAKSITVTNSGSAERFSIQDNGTMTNTFGATTILQHITRNTGIIGVLGNGANYALNYDTINGRVGIGDVIAPTEKLEVNGNVKVSGHFSAATKSFLIDHPTKAGKKLQYGVVESNQHSVLVRGKTAESIIELPEEWAGLVHEDSVTVQLTPIDSYQSLFVISQDNQKVVVGGSSGQYNYTIYGERKDVDKLVTEI